MESYCETLNRETRSHSLSSSIEAIEFISYPRETNHQLVRYKYDKDTSNPGFFTDTGRPHLHRASKHIIIPRGEVVEL